MSKVLQLTQHGHTESWMYGAFLPSRNYTNKCMYLYVSVISHEIFRVYELYAILLRAILNNNH